MKSNLCEAGNFEIMLAFSPTTRYARAKPCAPEHNTQKAWTRLVGFSMQDDIESTEKRRWIATRDEGRQSNCFGLVLPETICHKDDVQFHEMKTEAFCYFL